MSCTNCTCQTTTQLASMIAQRDALKAACERIMRDWNENACEVFGETIRDVEAALALCQPVEAKAESSRWYRTDLGAYFEFPAGRYYWCRQPHGVPSLRTEDYCIGSGVAVVPESAARAEIASWTK